MTAAHESPLVFVGGMPRSGTSAIAGSMVALGLATDHADDANIFNPKGFYESPLLGDYCIAYLDTLGGNWSIPPVLDETSDLFSKLVEGAKVAMATALPESPAVWKDPRATLILPVWRQATTRPLGTVLVWRSPLESALSLWRWIRFDIEFGLALWAEYNLRALRYTRGLPIYIGRYETILAEPDHLIGGVTGLLDTLGVTGLVTEDSKVQAREFLDPGLHRERRPPGNLTWDSQLKSLGPILEFLERHDGLSETNDFNDIPPIPTWAEAVLTEIREDVSAVRTRRTSGRAGRAAPRPEISNHDFGNIQERQAYIQATLESVGQVSKYLGTPGNNRVFGLVLATWKPPVDSIKATLGSMIIQGCQIFICDDNTQDSRLSSILNNLTVNPDVAVKTHDEHRGFNVAFKTAYAMATTEFVCLMDQFDLLHPQCVEVLNGVLQENPNVDLMYTDEDKFDVNQTRLSPDIKPDWSPDLAESDAYMGHLLVVRRSILDKAGGIGDSFPFDGGYDIFLRCSEVTSRIVHIPVVLYHFSWSMTPEINEPTRTFWQHRHMRRSLTSALTRRGGDFVEVQDGPSFGTFYVRRPVTPGTRVEVVILGHLHESGTVVGLDTATRKSRKAIERTAGHLLANIHEIGDVGGGWSDLYARANQALLGGDADHVCLVHADIVVEGDWLVAMVEQAQREPIGVVGARIVDEAGRIQHSGIRKVGDHFAWHGGQLDGRSPDLLRWSGAIHNVSGVTSACMVLSRDLFERLGGFNAAMAGYADLDLCLRSWEGNKRCLVTPLAEVLHRGVPDEGLSEGPSVEFLTRWGDYRERFGLDALS